MRVRVTREHQSTQVTQVVRPPTAPTLTECHEGILLRARVGHAKVGEAQSLQDGLRAKARLSIRLAEGDQWISAPVRSYGHKTCEVDGVRIAYWEVWTEHSKYRLDVLDEGLESAKTPRRR